MKKKVVILFVALFCLIGYVSKPEDKKCIIAAITAVWGSRTPTLATPQYYEQFMETLSHAVEVNDWIVLKVIRYKYKDRTRIIGFGAFNKVFIY